MSSWPWRSVALTRKAPKAENREHKYFVISTVFCFFFFLFTGRMWVTNDGFVTGHCSPHWTLLWFWFWLMSTHLALTPNAENALLCISRAISVTGTQISLWPYAHFVTRLIGVNSFMGSTYWQFTPQLTRHPVIAGPCYLARRCKNFYITPFPMCVSDRPIWPSATT